LSFQPSEIAKPALIITLGYWAGRVGNRIRDQRTFLIGFLLVLIPLLLVAVEPDLGTSIVILATTSAVAFVAGSRLRHFLYVAVVLALGVGLSIMHNPYQFTRIQAFFSPGDDLLGSGYQAQQSLLALGSGGITGKGLGMGTMKFLYLPAPHTDSVFAVIGEELGLLGTAALTLLFVMLLARGLWIAYHAPDTYGRCLAAGISFQLTTQAFINMLVVTGRLPVTGLPLPFISSGGTSLIVSLAMLGILMNVSRAASLGARR
ncbi:MAG TPA: FtsW/RodA/SpoVE family cell cycle protein, partial [Chloroflexota bacterium]|nr:FtsW/RodA/SpoVE family cell cycle protein [Chloroflexota bacterium]